MSRPRTPRGAGSRQVVVRLSKKEDEQITKDAEETGFTEAELLRRSYFGPFGEEESEK